MTRSEFAARRGFLAGAGALALAGCVQPRMLGEFAVTEVRAPEWKVGDAWTYRRTDAFTRLDAGSPIVVSVTGRTDAGWRVLTQSGGGPILDDALYATPGIKLAGALSEDGPIIGRYSPAVEVYAFPISSGRTWRQRITRTDANGSRYYASLDASVEGWQSIWIAGRDRRAIVIRRRYNLGPRTPFDGDLLRWETEWYLPELGASARLYVEEWYYDAPGQVIDSMTPGSRYLYELLEFKPG